MVRSLFQGGSLAAALLIPVPGMFLVLGMIHATLYAVFRILDADMKRQAEKNSAYVREPDVPEHALKGHNDFLKEKLMVSTSLFDTLKNKVGYKNVTAHAEAVTAVPAVRTGATSRFYPLAPFRSRAYPAAEHHVSLNPLSAYRPKGSTSTPSDSNSTHSEHLDFNDDSNLDFRMMGRRSLLRS